MKLNLDLAVPSKQEWIDAVMADFPSFLQDHADCERKASAMAMSFVAKYPNRTEILPELIATGIEELEHFQQVYDLMAKRGIELSHSIGEDLYVKQLIKLCHSGREERFLDRLLVASVVETRGAERFRMVSDIFVKMALNYFPQDEVYKRLEWWVEKEGEILDGLEIKAALH